MNDWVEQDAQNVSISYEADARFDNAYARVDALTDELLALCGDRKEEQLATIQALLIIAERAMILLAGPKRAALMFRYHADKLARGKFVDPRKDARQ